MNIQPFSVQFLSSFSFPFPEAVFLIFHRTFGPFCRLARLIWTFKMVGGLEFLKEQRSGSRRARFSSVFVRVVCFWTTLREQTTQILFLCQSRRKLWLHKSPTPFEWLQKRCLSFHGFLKLVSRTPNKTVFLLTALLKVKFLFQLCLSDSTHPTLPLITICRQGRHILIKSLVPL